MGGTAEDALDTACGLYLADPTEGGVLEAGDQGPWPDGRVVEVTWTRSPG